MEAQEIVDFVNRDLKLMMHGWRVRAEVGDTTKMSVIDLLFLRPDFDGSTQVTLKATWTNIDTDRDYARRGRERLYNDLSRGVVIDAANIETQEDILREVHGLLTRAFSHEVLEAMRIRSRDYFAPFHPHRADGIEAFGRDERDIIAFLMQRRPEDVTDQDIKKTEMMLV